LQETDFGFAATIFLIAPSSKFKQKLYFFIFEMIVCFFFNFVLGDLRLRNQINNFRHFAVLSVAANSYGESTATVD
jgi:hypothetical protein